ncbi:MerR family transcriptional regulator [Methylobacterium ajmalii]|jgi:DNA-binding transcriptional MerR regulator|uniref:MerR family transcriptional regulator n=1 Tax=Methylobacterium ajmalii TaxID=2738439 RepID=UPI00190AAC13|nr:MerR family transcriptional regulator [Methylobacterium ajmalii]MBK3398907.1 MerR family transcriptional regulator [Methylobacterium ajmalii]MBK3409564.1 MerR family transcriptional regulator [Methylobacterium ajmalii]MBK3425671.1 MerR family transcriptional regulator [Methylobacterium ajmalii]
MPSLCTPTFVPISAAVERLDLPAHVLRFWGTQFAQIRPVIRAGGRRYYSQADLELIAGIKVLLREQRLTIAGAKQLLQQRGISHVRALGKATSDQTTTPMSAGTVRSALDATAARAVESGTSMQIVGEQLAIAGIKMLRECGADADTFEKLALANVA